MNDSEVTFQVIVQLTVEPSDPVKNGAQKSRLSSCSIAMDTSKNVDSNAYVNKNGLTETGSKTVTTVLVQGISAHIHAEHQSGRRDSAEHLRAIIKDLEKAFMMHVDVNTEAELKDLKK